MDVAVLGMGRMGSALAGRLLGDGHRVVVWNRSPGCRPGPEPARPAMAAHLLTCRG
jgi:3-hydroxyisobutyrate dehydrogenase-like beta-hydroxyacid dehydrogenase